MKTVNELANINKFKADASKTVRPSSAAVKLEGGIRDTKESLKEKPPKANMPRIDEKPNEKKLSTNSRTITQQSSKDKQQQQQQKSSETKKLNIEVLMNKEMRMHRILPENTMYRIAQPQNSGYEISEKYWKESNKTNTKSRPNTAGSFRSSSMPRFKNETLRALADPNQMEDNNLQFENQNLETAAANFNAKANFQRAVFAFQKPFSFLSSIGGNKTSLREITSSSNKDNSVEFTATTEIKLYNNIDIDKSIRSQIFKRPPSSIQQRPQTVNTFMNQYPPTRGMPSATLDKRAISQVNVDLGLNSVMNTNDEAKTGKQRPMTAQPLASSSKPSLKPNSAIGGSRTKPSSAAGTTRANVEEIKKKMSIQSQIIGMNPHFFLDDNQFDELGIQEDLEENDDVYRDIDQAKTYNKPRPKSSLMQSRPLSGKSALPEQFFNQFTKYTNFNDVELPYEELFDRNERTIAATFAKFGDLGYYSPIQRVGVYMQFSAKLKREHLLEIIDLQRTITNVEKSEFEIPIQLAITDETDPFQKRIKTGISTTFKAADLKRIPITLSLFPEYIDDPNDENMTSAEAAEKILGQMLDEMGGVYDPEHLGKSKYFYIDPETWPDAIKKKVQSSCARYVHYVEKDLIKPNEISKFKKEWIKNALTLVPEKLCKNEESVKKIFQEIFESFKQSSKECMLDYILRSPEERKRLHIELIPRKFLNSAERISREGGYSIDLYMNWHKFVTHGRNALKSNIVLMNIVNSSIMNWYADFQEMRLLELETMKVVGVLGHTLSISAFIKLENIYRSKTISLLKNIWYRGAVCILRKFKYLRKMNLKKGKWTFNGFKENRNPFQKERKILDTSSYLNNSSQSFSRGDLESDSENVYNVILHTKLDAECKFETGFDYYSGLSLADLQDIRDNPAYKIYSITVGAPLKLYEDGWKALHKDQRHMITRSVGILMSLQLRVIVEESIESFANFFINIPTFENIKLHTGGKILKELSFKDGYDKIKDSAKAQKNKRIVRNSILKDSKITLDPIPRKPENKKEEDKKQKNLTNLISKLDDNTKKTASVINQIDLEKELDLNLIDILAYHKHMYPILKIEMIIDDEELTFKETEEYIRTELLTYLRSVVHSFDDFLHPAYTKVVIEKDEPVQIQSQKNEDEDVKVGRRHAFQAEAFLTSDHETNYNRFCSFVKVKERLPKKNVQKKVNIEGEVDEKKDQKTEKKKFLKAASLTEKVFIHAHNAVVGHIMTHFNECAYAFHMFDQFLPFINKDIFKEIQIVIQKKNFDLNEYKNYVTYLNRFANLLYKMPNSIYYPLFDINLEKVKDQLKKMIEHMKDLLLNRLEEFINDNMKSICERYSTITNVIRKSITTAEEVETMEKYIYELGAEQVLLKTKAHDVFKKLIFLMGLDHICSETLFNYTKELYEWPLNLERELKSSGEKHAIERARLEDKVRKSKLEFEAKVRAFGEEIKGMETYTEYSKYKLYIEEIEKHERWIMDNEIEMKDILDQEKKLFGFPSNYDIFLRVQDFIKPFSELWKALGNFVECKKNWMNREVFKIDAGEVDSVIKQNSRIASRLLGSFSYNSLSYRMVTDFQEDITQLKKHHPSIELISNPGLRDRHWEEILKIMNISFNYKEGTLKEILFKGVEQYLPQIEEISERASKEFRLENMLDKMEKEWSNLDFVIIEWKNRGIKILQGARIEEIQTVLDEHTVKAQSIRVDPYNKFMEERAIKWERTMLFIQEIIDLWIKVQTAYLYLEPLFNFEDINKNLAREAEKFKMLNSNWHFIMNSVEEHPSVLGIEKIQNIEGILKRCINWIDEIQRGLEEHLEEKRIVFPRFYFLANEDLLTILAETRDPQLVQPHLKKCFEGIYELNFNTLGDIFGMRSIEGEEIPFADRISPKHYKSNVEKWLLKVEEQMRESLKKLIEDSFMDISNTNITLTEWVRKWQGQVVICVNQLRWTERLEAMLEDQRGLKGLKTFHEELNFQLEDIVNLIRSGLTPLERLTLGALIVTQVHNKDVVRDLINKKVEAINSFDWQSQMRYYFDIHSLKVFCNMITTSAEYGYEYLGNTGRLVMTPLTDRCYRTLMSAIHLNLGGAPEGPAGTGKTETVKDLAKNLAMHCLVFNCSEGLNTHSMAKFFKGLASCGSWSCFDEFNRIDVEVLSVIAQQILQIQQAKNMAKTRFFFEGTELDLKFGCNIFITMNPGYAGRSDLPDNLKALFRPVAMMVPDYSLIAEILLYSFGYLDARNLSNKIVATYKLCSEQLSSQDHYDYGMRAVRAVLTSANTLKRKNSSDKEDSLILRALTEVNLPKFLPNDIILFNGIINDLFPKVQVFSPEYSTINSALNTVLQAFNLQNVPNFRKKVLQMYEMISCRHGFMTVGKTMSGKTSCFKVMIEMINEAARLEEPDEQPAHYYIINPKSITINQLYGYSDPISKEWTEGILADIFRKCATNTTHDRQLILLDGPVDADWIENMNTVLDDNKKLCLMNGEAIQMTPFMTMAFEVQDLLQASPATVSRCGMIYMSPDQLGWRAVFKSWLKELGDINTMEELLIRHLDEVFDAMVQKLLDFVKNECFEFQKIEEIALVSSLMKIMKILLGNSGFFVKDTYSHLRPDDINSRLDQIFLFAAFWSIGGALDDASRKKFNKHFRKLHFEPVIQCETIKNKSIRFDKQAIIPETQGAPIYDFFVKEFRWTNWREKLENEDPTKAYAEAVRFHEIMVKTVESERLEYLLSIFIKNNLPLLLVGPTATGKTVLINDFLRNLPMEEFLIINVNFSAKITAGKCQKLIDSRLEKRRKGIYGPKLNMKCLIFIDDLNMPALDKYGAQPPIELLRQFFDHKGWYGFDRNFMKIIESQIIGAMGPPGGGRKNITGRMIRHFNVVSCVENDQKNLTRIYLTIMDWFLQKRQITGEVSEYLKYAVDAAVELYTQVSANIKATPNKPHYIFNLRDLSRVIQGIQLCNKKSLEDGKKVARLCMHEFSRVYFDRLTSEADQSWFYTNIINVCRSKLKEDPTMAFKGVYTSQINFSTPEPLRILRFGDLMSNEINASDRTYNEILSYEKLVTRIETFLDDFNSVSRKPMKLVLFEYAIDHILKICRVLKLSRGHALLVGLGGFGRQSLTRLASGIMDFDMFEIEVNKNYTADMWKQDMVKLMILTGIENKKIVFLVNESHFAVNFIMEDIDSLINTGDIPNLWSQEEFLTLIDKVNNNAKKENRLNLVEKGSNLHFYNFFIESVRHYLHIVMAMTPISEIMRNRVRMFPSLFNCSTVIWYKDWPEEALQQVGEKFIQDLYLEPEMTKNLVQTCKYMHKSVIKLSEEYYRQESRQNYITPKSYLELIYLVQSLIGKQRKRIEEKRSMYALGVKKLLQTAENVKKMEEILTEKTPQLVKTKEEVSLMGKKIQQQADAMEPKRKKVEIEEAKVNERVKEAELIKEDCDKDLSEAKPKLKKAEEALNTLDQNEIIKLKAMQTPPDTVRLVLEAVCVLCAVRPVSIPGPINPKERILSYWEASKKFMGEKDFLQKLINYDKDNIPENIINRIRTDYIARTNDFNPKRAEKASSAVKGLCEWVLAIDEYEKVLRIVRPKQLKAMEANKEVEDLQQSLRKTQEELNQLTQEISKLKEDYNFTLKKEEGLENDIIKCETQIKRAGILVNGLAGEKDRWFALAESLQKSLDYVVGDVLLSSAYISYLGFFSSKYRERCLKDWINFSKTKNINLTENFTLEACLGDPMEFIKWKINSLPNDTFSKENGIITYNSIRYPLLIDPQSQANKWIKKNEASNKLVVTKFSESNFFRSLEGALQYGYPLLIENVGEDVDSTLYPLFEKQIFKNSGIPSIKLGDIVTEFNKNFRLFITSKLQNPHYLPETSTKLTLVNFMITKDGLEDQLLDLSIRKERPELEDMMSKLITQDHENKTQLREVEQNILDILNSESDILEDEKAVEVLTQSKNITKEIIEKQKAAEQVEKKIQEAKLGLHSISSLGAVLYSTINALSALDMMYYFSLNWFLGLFQEAFDKAEKSNFLEQKVENIINKCMSIFHQAVSRSLYDKHKLIFTFSMMLKILENNKTLEMSEFIFFISPITVKEEVPVNLLQSWLPNDVWWKSFALSRYNKKFEGLTNSFSKSIDDWKSFLSNPKAYNTPFPEPFHEVTKMQRLCLLKVLRPDQVLLFVNEYISSELGHEFTHPVSFNLQKSYDESSCTSPMTFLLPGTDPMSTILLFSEHKTKPLKIISLGQGQGVYAEKAIEEAQKEGNWVLLQNCHLAPSWMPKLEKIHEEIDSKAGREKTHPSFRLLLTTYRTKVFPAVVLQDSVKITNEPPTGLKSNIAVSLSSENISDKNFFEAHPNKSFKRVIFSLCFFHAVIQERRTFGPLGWNIYYDFNQSDLRISSRQVSHFLVKDDEGAFEALRYLIGECNYGGRITDENDRLLMMTLVDEFFSTETLNTEYRIGQQKEYKIPPAGSIDSYLKFIDDLPAQCSPEIFGLHSNADYTREIKDSSEVCDCLLMMNSSRMNTQGPAGSKNEDSVQKTDEEIMMEEVLVVCDNILINLNTPFDLQAAEARFPVMHDNSMNSLLQQEIVRYNKLISVVVQSLKGIQLALSGVELLSESLEKVMKSLLTKKVPELWLKNSYPTLKPLGGFVKDLKERISYFKTWVEGGQPRVNWISGFFFTQSFITAILQNYARKYYVPIDKLTFNFEVMGNPRSRNDIGKNFYESDDGALIYGLFLEGARFDFDDNVLEESQAKILWSEAPVIKLVPIDKEKEKQDEIYRCPVYRTAERKGVLMTTGHSSNYIMKMNLPTKYPETHWVKRGVAMVTQLSD